MPARAQAAVDRLERRRPLPGVGDGLRGVAGQQGHVPVGDGHRRRVTLDPPHLVSTRRRARHRQRGRGRVDPDDVVAAGGEQEREPPGAAPDVQHPVRPEPDDEVDVGREIGASRVQRVVQRCEPRVLELLVGHGDSEAPGRPAPPSLAPG